MNMQKGNLLINLFWIILLGFFIYAGMRIVPHYLENRMIKQTLKTLKQTPDIQHMSQTALQSKLLKLFQVNSIKDTSPENLKLVNKNNQIYLNLAYEVKVSLFSNLGAYMTFNEEVLIE